MDVPVAALNVPRGGSDIHQWFPLAYDPNDSACGGSETTIVPGVGIPSSSNSNYFNWYINPIKKMPFHSFIWFQGESESSLGTLGNPQNSGYACAQANMVTMFRSEFGWNVPVGVTGLFSNNNENNANYFRVYNQQPAAAQMEGVWYVSASDQGQNGGSDDAHPETKTQVGRRHAPKLLKEVNGLDIASQGPDLSSTPFSIVSHLGNEYLRIEFDMDTAYNLTFMDTVDCAGSKCCITESGFRIKFSTNNNPEDFGQVRIGFVEPGAVYIDLTNPTPRIAADIDEVMLNYEQFAECTLGNEFGCIGGLLPAREFHRTGLAGNIPVGTILPGDVVSPGDPDVCPQIVPPTPEPTRSPTTPAPTRGPTQEPTKDNQPTVAPTKSPSRTPTRSPTKNPTKSPTREPTDVPTRSPTAKPSKSPSRSPTPYPTPSPPSSYTRSPW